MVASGIAWTREAVCAACGSGQRLITATTSGMTISHCYRCGDSSTSRAAVIDQASETQLDVSGRRLTGAPPT